MSKSLSNYDVENHSLKHIREALKKNRADLRAKKTTHNYKFSLPKMENLNPGANRY